MNVSWANTGLESRILRHLIEHWLQVAAARPAVMAGSDPTRSRLLVGMMWPAGWRLGWPPAAAAEPMAARLRSGIRLREVFGFYP
jgi:hypothetical protein